MNANVIAWPIGDPAGDDPLIRPALQGSQGPLLSIEPPYLQAASKQRLNGTWYDLYQHLFIFIE